MFGGGLRFQPRGAIVMQRGSVYFAYDFIRIHRTLRMTPAMAACVTGRLWEVLLMADAELVVVSTFLNKIDAEIARGALQAADIESLVSADDAGGLRPTLWMGGVRLLVRAKDAEQAHKILSSSK